MDAVWSIEPRELDDLLDSFPPGVFVRSRTRTGDERRFVVLCVATRVASAASSRRSTSSMRVY
jgi:hypothetical protein